jgi:hypothetical protein
MDLIVLTALESSLRMFASTVFRYKLNPKIRREQTHLPANNFDAFYIILATHRMLLLLIMCGLIC